MSGYADYSDPKLQSYPHFEVPVIKATPENFKEYGNFVTDYENEKVIIVPWPVQGKRPLMFDTGRGGGISEGKFQYKYVDNTLRAVNHAVGGNYTTAINFETNIKNDVPEYILTREANYHPDGGQVFYPIDKGPFILILALPTDDIKMSDFVAFWFDGSQGVQIKPNIWHQPIFPLSAQQDFMTKQGAVHGCVGFDSIEECGMWLRIDMKKTM